ncbi:MAG: hypothetical protein EPN82_09815 [Bacteroidetes bacterium]|nr:MAG: hypothetical protein EPN82_09815 [Bacteroidota bacterium]
MLTFILTNVTLLINYLKQFITIDSNSLLEITPEKNFVIKSYTAARTAVIVGKIELGEFCKTPLKVRLPKRVIKCGIYNTKLLIDMLTRFQKNTEIQLTLQYHVENNGELVGDNIILSDFNKEFNLRFAQISLFKDMEDDIADSVFDMSKSYFSFELPSTKLKEIKADAALQNGFDLEIFPRIINNKKFVCFTGKDFSDKIPIETDLDIGNIQGATITKEYFRYLDKDSNYTCHLTETSVLFISDKFNTKTCFGRVMNAEDEL